MLSEGSKGWQKEINLVCWNDRKPKVDIRDWAPEHEKMGKGVTVSGEKTLPVLEAAHIQPYSQQEPHNPNNGLLLRQDIHTLFDRGYLTISDDLHVEVSKRIKEDFGNGREYYSFHGRQLLKLPDNLQERPSSQFIRWHNENVYLG